MHTSDHGKSNIINCWAYIPLPLTDKDIGYGPPAAGASAARGGSSAKAEDQVDFHPPAPPITGKDGSVEDAHDVIRFDSNFYVAKKTDAGDVRQVGDSTSVPCPSMCNISYL